MKLTKSRTAKVAAGFVGFAMAVSAFIPVMASADTASDLQAQINSLLATISSLQAQLSAVTGSSMSGGYTFNTNLTMGSTGTDVMNLQKVLNMSADTKIASSGVGSPGNETSFFGGLTKAAVIKFQTKNGISPAAGYVGPITRAKLNTMSGGVTTPTIPGVGGGALSISSGIQPSNSLAPKGAARVPFTRFTLTAGPNDVTVNSVTVQRSGFAQDAALSGVVLLNGDGLQVGIAKTLNSNHQAMIGEPMVIKAGTSQTFTVAGNMASSLTLYVGQVLSLDVVAVNTSASVSGSFPITGAQQTLNDSLTVGTATVSTSSFDPNSGTTQPIGTTGYRFSGFKVTAGSAEDLTLKSVRWNQTGSAGATDLANVVTVVNGTQYPTVVSADGKYFTTVFSAGGVVIAKGNSIDIYIQGDIVGSGAAGRTAEFDVYKNTDLYLTGNTYGYGVTAPTGSGVVLTALNHITVVNTSSNPWFEGSNHSISAGSVTLIGKATEVPAQNIAINVPNQVLGGFATNFSGEPVSIQSLYFSISTTSGSLPTTANSPYSAITNITLVDENGAVVAGPVDAGLANGITAHGNVISAATSYAWILFTDTVTFKTGRHVYTLKGKIPSGWANNAAVTIYVKPSTDWTNATGQTTGNSIDLSGQSTAFSMNTVTVKGAALAVNVSAQPAAQNVVRGVQNFVLANYQLDATQSGEDIRLSAMPVIIETNLSTAVAITDLTGCVIWNGTTQLNTGSRVINTITDNTAKPFNFDNSLTIPKGTSITLALSCNVASGGSQTYYQVLRDATNVDWSVTGITSGNSVTTTGDSLTFGSGDGGLMTVTTGSFTVAIDSSTPNYALASAGSSGVTIGIFKFRATNEDVNLTRVGLILSTSTAADLGTVYLYQGGTLLGTAIFPQGASATATTTLNTPLKLTRDTDVLITIKSDLAAIGLGQSGHEGVLVKIDATNAEGSGLSSGNTLQVGGIIAGVNGVRVFKSYPTVTQDTLGSTGLIDGKLMRFKVKADNAGSVGLYQFRISLATSTFATGGGVSNVKLYAYSDSGYSSPISTAAGSGQVGNTQTATTSAPIFTIAATTNPVVVPAGSTYYFEVAGSIAGSQTGATAATTLLGDAAYITGAHMDAIGPAFVSTTTGAVADGANFIWSGNATTTAVFNANDWGNGYGILNLPSAGFTQTRSN